MDYVKFGLNANYENKSNQELILGMLMFFNGNGQLFKKRKTQDRNKTFFAKPFFIYILILKHNPKLNFFTQFLLFEEFTVMFIGTLYTFLV